MFVIHTKVRSLLDALQMFERRRPEDAGSRDEKQPGTSASARFLSQENNRQLFVPAPADTCRFMYSKLSTSIPRQTGHRILCEKVAAKICEQTSHDKLVQQCRERYSYLIVWSRCLSRKRINAINAKASTKRRSYL